MPLVARLLLVTRLAQSLEVREGVGTIQGNRNDVVDLVLRWQQTPAARAEVLLVERHCLPRFGRER